MGIGDLKQNTPVFTGALQTHADLQTKKTNDYLTFTSTCNSQYSNIGH